MEWYMWLTLGLSIAAGITGGLLAYFVTAIRETGEFLICVADAIEDGKITKTEAGGLIKAWTEAQSAWAKVMVAVLSVFKRR